MSLEELRAEAVWLDRKWRHKELVPFFAAVTDDEHHLVAMRARMRGKSPHTWSIYGWARAISKWRHTKNLVTGVTRQSEEKDDERYL